MTDNEIIKVLECCSRNNCSGCTLSHKSIKDCLKTAIKAALDIIKRQKAIFDCLEGKDFIQIEENFNKVIRAVKTKAYTEFAERLCDGMVSNDPVVIAAQAELKELVGDDK